MKPEKKISIFLKKGKTIISLLLKVENLEFLYISDDKTDFIIEFVLGNLITQSNFVKL